MGNAIYMMCGVGAGLAMWGDLEIEDRNFSNAVYCILFSIFWPLALTYAIMKKVIE